MSYNLYLDDERMPKTETKFFIVRNYEDFVYTVTSQGIPQYISFDHDLGLHSGTGYDCATWLAGYVLGCDNKLPVNFNYNVHSANPVGSKRIIACMENLIKLNKELKANINKLEELKEYSDKHIEEVKSKGFSKVIKKEGR